MKQLSAFDQIIGRFDKILRGLPSKKVVQNSLPSLPSIEMDSSDPVPLSLAEQKHAASLMRINHCGEVCAQALYLGQALVARDQKLANQLYKSAEEEQEHLQWCKTRIHELGGRPSILNPLWALGSFGIGVTAGLFSDKISLGFLAETEQQVSRHLASHLQELPAHDTKSQAIILKMREDEERHAKDAITLGGVNLPKPIPKLMQFFAKIMTTTTRYI